MIRINLEQSIAQKVSLARIVKTIDVLYRLVSRHDTILVGSLLAIIVVVNSMAVALQAEYLFDGHHPGNMLNGALNLLHGEPLLSRVQSIYGLFLPYLNALQLYLFGEKYISLWVLPLIGFSVGLVIYYKLFKDFLNSLESLLAVFIILAVNQAVLVPWANYVVFGMNALLIWFFSRDIQQTNLKSSTLFGVGALLFASTLLRSQAILLYPAFLVLLFLYRKEDWFSKSVALSLGLFGPLAIFALKLAYDGVLRDYYVQTIAIQDLFYFRDKSVFKGVHQIFEVFATGHAPVGLPKKPTGFAPFAGVFGGLWFCIFLANAYILIEFGVRMVSGPAERDRLRTEVPPSAMAIAVLTAIGPLFSLHNVWDNFRYALHIAQGSGVVFYLVDRSLGRRNSLAIILTLSLFFFAPFYSVVDNAKSSFSYLRERVKNPPKTRYAKYFEGVELQASFRDRLIFAENFFEAYYKKYPDSYVYTDLHTITDGLYAIGKFSTYDKTLTNNHFVSTYSRYYPEYPAKFEAAARSRKLIFFSSRAPWKGLKLYDYVQFREVNGLFVFIARERAESFSMP